MDIIRENFKKASYYTLGCKLNFTETSAIKQYFLARGIQPAKKGEDPDIVVINTCSVTESAEKKCCRLIRRIRNIYPDSFLIVTGCYAQLRKDEISSIKGVDWVIGSDEKKYLADYILIERKEKVQVSSSLELEEFIPSCSYGDRTRGFLKIQDGCDYTCSYCTIPLARGKSRNGLVSDLVRSAKKMLYNGVKEIVLTGVNIGDFGKSTNENLLGLVRELDAIEEKVRFRISSIEPNLLTDELIAFIAHSDHFVPHFHLPLQSGCDAVLQLMKRRYTTALFRHRIETIKTGIPYAFIGLDVIVGMRGETGQYFEETRKFLECLPLSQLHIFPYSERPGTEALKIYGLVSPKEKQVRSKQLLALSNRKKQKFYSSQIATPHRVLFENNSRNNKMYGFTDNYIRVEAVYRPQQVNRFLQGTLRTWNENKTALTIDF